MVGALEAAPLARLSEERALLLLQCPVRVYMGGGRSHYPKSKCWQHAGDPHHCT